MHLIKETHWALILLAFVLVSAMPSTGIQVSKLIVKKSLEVTTEDTPNADPETGHLDVDDLTPKTSSFFQQKDSLDKTALVNLDCHMRNLDFCYAGMLGSLAKVLPETDAEFEIRCDEMKATMACIAVYNDRCQTFRVFSSLSPLTSYGQLMGGESTNTVVTKYVGDPNIPSQLEQTLMNRAANESEALRLTDLMGLCDPTQKDTPANKRLRGRLFEMAKCINVKLPALRPCIEDLKVALQIFYEPNRVLPVRPSCCAMSRFRTCASQALNNICGLSSFEQLEKSMSSSAGLMMKSVERVCRQGSAHHDSPYCQDILPPSGIKPTAQRRGHKASKLARALDLISFAPPA